MFSFGWDEVFFAMAYSKTDVHVSKSVFPERHRMGFCVYTSTWNVHVGELAFCDAVDVLSG